MPYFFDTTNQRLLRLFCGLLSDNFYAPTNSNICFSQIKSEINKFCEKTHQINDINRELQESFNKIMSYSYGQIAADSAKVYSSFTSHMARIYNRGVFFDVLQNVNKDTVPINGAELKSILGVHTDKGVMVESFKKHIPQTKGFSKSEMLRFFDLCYSLYDKSKKSKVLVTAHTPQSGDTFTSGSGHTRLLELENANFTTLCLYIAMRELKSNMNPRLNVFNKMCRMVYSIHNIRQEDQERYIKMLLTLGIIQQKDVETIKKGNYEGEFKSITNHEENKTIEIKYLEFSLENFKKLESVMEDLKHFYALKSKYVDDWAKDTIWNYSFDFYADYQKNPNNLPKLEDQMNSQQYLKNLITTLKPADSFLNRAIRGKDFKQVARIVQKRLGIDIELLLAHLEPHDWDTLQNNFGYGEQTLIDTLLNFIATIVGCLLPLSAFKIEGAENVEKEELEKHIMVLKQCLEPRLQEAKVHNI